MKRLLLTALASAAIISANAQNVDEVQTNFRFGRGIHMIPSKYTSDGKALLYDKTESNGIGVYDASFNFVKSISEEVVEFYLYDVEQDVEPDNAMCITQTLFNKDGKFEYFRLGDVVGNEWDYLYGSLSVVQDDGTVLYTFKPAAGCSAIYGDEYIEVLNSYDGVYITIPSVGASTRDDDEDYATYTVYRWTADGNGVEKVREYSAARAYPNPVSRHSRLTLDIPAGEGEATIIVTNMAGQTVRTLETGKNRVQIPTAGMGTGQYNVTVVRGGKNIDTCKVIVK